MSKLLWVVQVLLAALFVFAGVAKLMMPVAALEKAVGLPGAFMRFIAVAELCGALGLLLPGLFRIKTWLTPLAASGLVVIMIGATTLTLHKGPASNALLPAITGVLALFTAWGRWLWAPLRSRAETGMQDSDGSPAGA